MGDRPMAIDWIDADQVRRHLPMTEAISLMERTMRDAALGNAVQPLRSVMPVAGHGLLSMMPATVGDVAGYKAVTVFPRNGERGIATHQAVIGLIDSLTGTPLAFVDGTSVTEIRTAAMSAVASRALARKDSRILTVIGAGAQAREHIYSLTTAFDLDVVRVWNRTAGRSQELADDLREQIGASIEVATSAEEAVADADVIVTATSAATPVILREWLAPGVHVNAVGACVPTARELDSPTIRDAHVFVDNRESALAEAGDIAIPIQEGAIGSNHIVAEIGDVLIGRAAGRTAPDQLTVFESLGVGIQDVASAHHVWAAARATGDAIGRG